MKVKKVAKIIGGLAAGALAAAAVPGYAQQYPNKPIRVIVGFGAGGGTDILARMIMPRLGERLGAQQVIIDNRPGVSGFLGAELAAKAPPDGHTLLFAAANLVMSLSIFPQQPVDPLKDFVPVSLLVTEPSLLAVHPSLPAKSVKELIALAKVNPGKINYAGGHGTTMHLNTELLKMVAQVNFTQVPYAGGSAQAVVGVLTGESPMIMAPISPVLPHTKSGRLRALAVTLPQRVPTLPELPTVAESLPGYSASVWYGVVAPAGTPPAIVARLQEELAKVMQLPEIKSRLEREGSIAGSTTSQQFAEIMRSDKAKWAKVLANSSAKPAY